jgi:prepilin-type N-terminal cleavage/methylation domain-containing protein/prepilin-type processing-associated H-X9-DG protein
MKGQRLGRTGFTLVELLVVVAIIGLLAAILLPSLANAREMAKASACLSNLHNAGTQLMLYYNDNHGLFPSSYSYVDGNSSAGGYYHWTAAISPTDYKDPVNSGKYPKYSEQYVCPSHTPGGWAPSNFTTGRIPSPPSGQVSQSAGIDDRQAARLSYVANEVIMPRKKYNADHDIASPPGTSNLCLVSADEVEQAQHTILLGEFSQSANCIWGSSVGGGSAYKSHRPTNGIKVVGGGVFDGEGYATGTQVAKLTYAEAQGAIDAVLADKSVAASSHHISYIDPNCHKSGSNYNFVDGHAAKFTLQDTLDQGNYMWGRKVYSCADKPVIQDN